MLERALLHPADSCSELNLDHFALNPHLLLPGGGRADFGLARSVRQPLEPLWNNGVVVTIWCVGCRAAAMLLVSQHSWMCFWRLHAAR
jgi:hypothetical protein